MCDVNAHPVSAPGSLVLFALGTCQLTVADIDEALLAIATLDQPAPGQPGADANAALTAFRYRRRLISAEELQHWLAAHGIDLGELTAALGGSAQRTPRQRMIARMVNEAWPQQVQQVAARLACWQQAGLALKRPWPWPAIDAQYQQWLANGRTTEARQRLLARDARRWSRVVYEVLEADTEAACREAWCCATADHECLAEIARRERLPHARHSALLAHLPGRLALLLSALRPGETAEPLLDQQPCLLLQLSQWQPPSLDDPDTRQAIDALVEEEMADAIVTAHVRWQV